MAQWLILRNGSVWHIDMGSPRKAGCLLPVGRQTSSRQEHLAGRRGRHCQKTGGGGGICSICLMGMDRILWSSCWPACGGVGCSDMLVHPWSGCGGSGWYMGAATPLRSRVSARGSAWRKGDGGDSRDAHPSGRAGRLAASHRACSTSSEGDSSEGTVGAMGSQASKLNPVDLEEGYRCNVTFHNISS